jgi:hypothetical protein
LLLPANSAEFNAYGERDSLAGCSFALEGGKVKKYSHDDALTTSASALLDHGAEVFTKKMFKHTQSSSLPDLKNRSENVTG